MNARCALSAIAALVIASQTFAVDQDTVEVGSFVNTSVGVMSYTGAYNNRTFSEDVDGHTVISVDVAGILDSLGYDMLWSITITDNGSNTYGSLSPGADIDLFRVEGAATDVTYSYLGPNPVHQSESVDRLADRLLQLDSYSGAQDAWDITQVSLGWDGAVTATFNQPFDLRQWFSNPGDVGYGGDGFGPNSFFNDPPDGGEGDPLPYLKVSEHGLFESFHITLTASHAVPAPGALALIGLAGIVSKSRRRK